MALITGRNSFDGGRALSESEWTKLLIERGEAISAEPHRLGPPGQAVEEQPVGPREDEAQDQEDDNGADEPLERIKSHAPIVSDALGPPSRERRRALREYAERLTGKRRSHDQNTS